jgi:hypothetical protein
VAVLGILKELKMDGKDMALAMQIFFVPYIIADIPSNIVLKRFAPSTWISALTFCWGKPPFPLRCLIADILTTQV